MSRWTPWGRKAWIKEQTRQIEDNYARARESAEALRSTVDSLGKTVQRGLDALDDGRAEGERHE